MKLSKASTFYTNQIKNLDKNKNIDKCSKNICYMLIVNTIIFMATGFH